MYNGIGLTTARGSGTSGHIQTNLSHMKKPRHSREDFLNELKSLRENVLPPPRKANP
jgi:serine/arginine repetitive matrix protein 2